MLEVRKDPQSGQERRHRLRSTRRRQAATRSERERERAREAALMLSATTVAEAPRPSRPAIAMLRSLGLAWCEIDLLLGQPLGMSGGAR